MKIRTFKLILIIFSFINIVNTGFAGNDIELNNSDNDLYPITVESSNQNHVSESNDTIDVLSAQDNSFDKYKSEIKNQCIKLRHNFINIFNKNTLNNILTNKYSSQKKYKYKKNSLMVIKESRNIQNIQKKINNEEYFKHNTKNKLYLDRFNTYGSKDEKTTFYEKKNIEENENGDIQLNNSEGIAIDKLIEEIEQRDTEDIFSPPIQISLRDCIGIAIAKHPNVLSAKLDTEIYRSYVIQAWSSYFPSLSSGLNYAYDYSREQSWGYGYSTAYFPTISAGMLLFDFGKTKTGVDIAVTNYDASRYNLQNTINELIYSVKSAYYNMLFAQMQITVYNATIEDFELQLASAQKYFSIGKKPQIDVAIAEYNAGNAKLNLVKAKNTLENAKVMLANTLGLPEFANFELKDDLPRDEYNTDLEILLQNAFNIRPDLLSAEKDLESYLLSVRKAKRNFAPNLTANGSMQYGGIEPMDTTSYRVSLDFAYSDLNVFQLKKDYDIALQSYKKALADYEAKRQNVYLEVKQAYISLNSAYKTLNQADLNVQQAKAQHYHAMGRYNAGVGDAIEMKDSENTFLNAQLSYYQALLDYNLEVANLERVVGCPVEKFSENPL